jgi:hypothetical protein
VGGGESEGNAGAGLVSHARNSTQEIA